MGIITGTESLGMMTSPFFGSILFSLGGYELPFQVLGALFTIASLCVFCFIPKSVDRNQPSQTDQGQKLTVSIQDEMHEDGLLITN